MRDAEHRLRALRDDLRHQLAERLPDPAVPLPELRELQERLRLVDAALQQRARWRSLLWPTVAIAAVLSAAALIPVPRVPFTLEAHAAHVRLRMPQAGTLTGQAADGTWRLEGYSAIETPDASLAAQAAAGPLSVEGTARLQTLQYPAGTLLTVAASGRSLRLGAEAARAPVSLELQMSGPVDYVAGEGRHWKADYRWGEWLRLRYQGLGKAAPPVELSLERRSDAAMQWTALRPEAVDFTQRQPGPDSTAQWTSSLRQARLVLPVTNLNLTLDAGDGLELGGLQLERGDLTAGSEVLLRLAGTASTIESQVGTFRRSLKPSVLEWLARHHTLGLLWTSAVFLWGVSAWLRKPWNTG